MHPIVARLILVLSLLMSLQASAGMMERGTSMKDCVEMGMDGPLQEQSNCDDASCCMAFVASTVLVVMPLVKIQADFQAAPVQSPLRMTRINFRPPINS